MVVYCVACYIFIEVIELNLHYGHLLRHLHCLTDQAMSEVTQSWGLTAAQGHILGFITHSAVPLCPRDIENTFHLSHPTVSGLLSRLEKKGFIACQADEQDHRRKRIHLLPKGLALDEAIHQAIEENEQRIVRDFSPEEQAQFRCLLVRAIRNMGGDPEKRKSFQNKEEIPK